MRFIRTLLFLLLASLLVAGEHSAQARVRTQHYSVPTPNSGPYGIVAGPNGASWFTETEGNKVGRITIAGAFKEAGIPTDSSQPYSITAGPEYLGNKVGRISLLGMIKESPEFAHGIGLVSITTGPDGALSFTEQTSNKIGVIYLS